MRSVVFASLLIGLFTLSPETLACECLGGTASGREALPAYSAVFLGYVVNIKLLTSDSPVRENEYRFDDQAEVTFRVRRSWKGAEQQIVKVLTATQGPACGYPFQVGQYYLVYALQADGPVLRCSTCSPTKEFGQAGQDMASLGPPTYQPDEKQSK